jgi:hypothetical protein
MLVYASCIYSIHRFGDITKNLTSTTSLQSSDMDERTIKEPDNSSNIMQNGTAISLFISLMVTLMTQQFIRPDLLPVICTENTPRCLLFGG